MRKQVNDHLERKINAYTNSPEIFPPVGCPGVRHFAAVEFTLTT